MFSLPAAKVGLAFRRRGCSPWIFRCNHSGLDPLNDEMMAIMKQNQVTSAGCGMIAVMQGCTPDFLAMSCCVLLCLAKGKYANKAKLLGNVEFKMQ